jgi:HD-like signal output (HDOD) protein
MVAPLSARQTSDRARSALRSGQGAGLPELLKLIEALSVDVAKSTISEIAELIEQDAAVMTRLLTIANTIFHNPHIAPLSSVPNAIHRVGFQRIRSLAVSLMLLENTGGAGKSPEQREAAAHALCAGLMAQGCARALGTVDSETAFACAALRQLGHIVLPSVSLPHYSEAQKRLKTRSEDAAYRSVFGITPLELSRVLLSGSRLPAEIMLGLRDSDPGAIADLPQSDNPQLLGIADLGGRLARLALESNHNQEVFGEQSRLLARQYERLLPGVGDLIEPALRHTDERIGSFTRAGAGNALPTAIMLRMRSRVRPGDQPVAGTAVESAATGTTGTVGPEAEPAGIATAAVPAQDAGASPASVATTAATSSAPVGAAVFEPAPPLSAEENWTEQLQRSAAFAAPETQPAERADPWLVAITALRDSFKADEVWVFLPGPGGKSLVLAHGIGGRWKEHRARASLRSDERTVFGVGLALRQTVAIHDTGDASIRHYLPEWFLRSEAHPGAFLLIPLAVPDQGIVLIGWPKPQRVVPTAAQTELARLLIASAAPARPSGN